MSKVFAIRVCAAGNATASARANRNVIDARITVLLAARPQSRRAVAILCAVKRRVNTTHFDRRLTRGFERGLERGLAPFFFGLTRSGSLALPVSRFHSSYVSGEIFPVTRSSANLRRCARLLKGIDHQPFIGTRRE